MSELFISYKRTDKEKVFRLKDEIERQTGLSCWIDLEGIESDAQFANVIISAINKAQVFLFMYSRSHAEIADFDNDWTVREINFAQKKGKRIVFLNIDGTPLTDWFELMFGTKQQVDATSDEMVVRLCKDLKKWISLPQSAQSNISKPTSNLHPQSINNANKQFKVRGVNFNMIFVEGGTFQMGATSEQGDYAGDDEKPAHSVTLSDYWIGETVVTQKLWKAVMGENPSNFKGSKLPVEWVSWDNCQKFVDKLNALTEESRPLGTKFRLPTEAEWEYAARGGKYKEGYRYSGSDDIDQVAWYFENSRFYNPDMKDKIANIFGVNRKSGRCTHDVKTKEANALGIYDMSGNVSEWCEDYYDSDYYSNSLVINPLNKYGDSNSLRVKRGGSWRSGEKGCCVFNRMCDYPYSHSLWSGMRLVLSNLHID